MGGRGLWWGTSVSAAISGEHIGVSTGLTVADKGGMINSRAHARTYAHTRARMMSRQSSRGQQMSGWALIIKHQHRFVFFIFFWTALHQLHCQLSFLEVMLWHGDGIVYLAADGGGVLTALAMSYKWGVKSNKIRGLRWETSRSNAECEEGAHKILEWPCLIPLGC